MSIDKRFAVLIDADNVSDRYIKYILNEISNEGLITYKRIYGNWTMPNMSSWKPLLLENSITPIQQYNYTTGKNATDSAMIIDAMDILYSKSVDGFCIVSSDSDFTRLASRLRESGMLVIGMGEKKTPRPFIAACNKFKYLDVLAQEFKLEDGVITGDDDDKQEADPTERLNEMAKILSAIITERSDEDGWAFLSDVGNILQKRYPDFDVRNYNCRKLNELVKQMNMFELKIAPSTDINVKLLCIRNKVNP